MYSKMIAMTAVCLGVFTNASAQTDSLAVRKGRVLDTKGEAIPGVIVSVSRTEERTIADEMGYFTLPDDVVAGDTLTFTSMGFKPTRRIVPPADGSNKTFTIRMKDGMTTLQEVEVVGRYEKSYKNTLSFIGTKTATPLKDIPQSIGYVTKELVLDQGAHTVNDVVKNTATLAISSTGCGLRRVCGSRVHWPISSAWRLSRVLPRYSLVMPLPVVSSTA